MVIPVNVAGLLIDCGNSVCADTAENIHSIRPTLQSLQRYLSQKSQTSGLFVVYSGGIFPLEWYEELCIEFFLCFCAERIHGDLTTSSSPGFTKS